MSNSSILNEIEKLRQQQLVFEKVTNNYRLQLAAQNQLMNNTRHQLDKRENQFDILENKLKITESELKKENNSLKRQLNDVLIANKKPRQSICNFSNVTDNLYYYRYPNSYEKIFTWFISINYCYKILDLNYFSSKKINFHQLGEYIRNFLYNKYHVSSRICDLIGNHITILYKRDVAKDYQILQINSAYLNDRDFNEISNLLIDISKNDIIIQKYHSKLPIISTNSFKDITKSY
jgi:hypothetical protein